MNARQQLRGIVNGEPEHIVSSTPTSAEIDFARSVSTTAPDSSYVAVSAPTPAPTPTPADKADTEEIGKEVDYHLERWFAEDDPGLKAAPWPLPELPPGAPAALHRAREFVAILFGIREAIVEYRPAPIAGAWAAPRMGVPDGPHAGRQARRLLSELVGYNVLRHPGRMYGRGGRSGTKLYLPGGELGPFRVELPHKPQPERAEVAPVPPAAVVEDGVPERPPDGTVAPERDAGGVHAEDGTPGRGAHDDLEQLRFPPQYDPTADWA